MSDQPAAYLRTAAVYVALLGALTSSVLASDTLPILKLFVEEDGAYRIFFEDLGFEDPGVAEDRITSDATGLTVTGKAVPIWIEDGGDGFFGPGDWLEFVGEAPRGEVSYFSEHSRFNVYFLRFDQANPARMQRGARSKDLRPAARFRTQQRLEHDLLLLRLAPRQGIEAEELWYWAKLASSSRKPFRQKLDLRDLDQTPGATVDLRIHLRGWSDPRKAAGSEIADHRVDVHLNGQAIAGAEWNGTDPYLLEIPPLPIHSFEAGPNTLTLEVPRRSTGEKGDDLIDVVVLNWIEVDYPRVASIGGRQEPFRLEEQSRSGGFRLESEIDGELLVYGARGSRWSFRSTTGGQPETWVPQPGEHSFVASHANRLKSPSAIVSDEPSQLIASTNRADYIIIAHPRLIDAIRPLAEFHRSRGLVVELVDIEDVYDEFNHGILHPRAVRAFLGHAYRNWQKPAPRFVLLVGDASWDARNSTANDKNYADWTYRPGERLRFRKNRSTPYPTNAELNHRGLIPTWNHTTNEGHSASDNFFVAIDGEDDLPDMAIGRLPVVEPEEVTAIVDKVIRYVSASEVGAWRRRILFITNESKALQRQSNRLAGFAASHGLATEKIYPESSETSNEHHSERLLELFDRGQLVVHFLGHGGRYIWRTGPPDLKKNHDLFTLEHLDQLEATNRLPVVLSLTCYSAPFDHPSADSIGEKLLRVPGRGAIAVVAASWRNNPSPRWGEALLEGLTAPGATVGEAVQSAKRKVKNAMFVETYNLLGDPAIPVAAPLGGIELQLASSREAFVRIKGAVDLEGFSGELILDLVDTDGEILRSSRRSIESPTFEIRFDRPELPVQSVRAYAWNAEAGIDAAGTLVVAPDRPAGRR